MLFLPHKKFQFSNKTPSQFCFFRIRDENLNGMFVGSVRRWSAVSVKERKMSGKELTVNFIVVFVAFFSVTLLKLIDLICKKNDNSPSIRTAPSVKCRLEFWLVQFHVVLMTGDVTNWWNISIKTEIPRKKWAKKRIFFSPTNAIEILRVKKSYLYLFHMILLSMEFNWCNFKCF